MVSYNPKYKFGSNDFQSLNGAPRFSTYPTQVVNGYSKVGEYNFLTCCLFGKMMYVQNEVLSSTDM